jgi:membrane-bound lytic murein transglycosylase A
MISRVVIGAALAALVLSACATPKYAAPQQRPGPFPVQPRPPAPTQPLSSLKGWAAEDHAAAFAAFRDTCHASRDPALAAVCRTARAMPPLDRTRARQFFEAQLAAAPLEGEGVLTAYFAPEYPARRTPDAEFSAPVRPKPADLTGGPYADRSEIEARPTTDALAWMRPEDLFFLQIQGSGVLTFNDGRRVKALYAANNGRPFIPIARPMREQGILPASNTSGDAIRAWLAANRGPAADQIMRLNPRYAFFRLAPDDGRHPVGAANIPLPPGRGVAVDTAFHALGQVFWIDASAPTLAGAFPAYRRLVSALDVGGAIKGEVRADLYLGLGDAAGLEAGRVRHTLRMFRLVPKAP